MTDEQTLIRRAQNRETDAFRQLVEQHRQNVYFLALNLSGNPDDAEDLAQEVFIRAFRFLSKFRGDAKFSSWLYRITINCHRSARRKKQPFILSMNHKGEENAAMQLDQLPDRKTTHPDDAAQDVDIQTHIRKALNGLTDRERTVFVLRHYQDMPLKEIAGALDIAEGTVKSLLFRAIRRLQKSLAFYRPDLGLEKS